MSSIQDQIKTSTGEEDIMFALQLVSSSTMPMVMNTVLQLNVLEILSRAGEGAHLSSVEIASHLPTQNPDAPAMLDRLLRLLANYSVLSCSTVVSDDGNVDRLYGLKPVCKYFIANEDGISLAPLMNICCHDACSRAWSGLEGAVLGGGDPFSLVHEMSIFDFAQGNPQFNESFNLGMFSHTKIIMKKLLEVYKGFEDLKELIDVGGGMGTASEAIINKYPAIKCINLDLPHVIQSIPSKQGIHYVGGDMFASIPQGEAIFMKWILHDWDDEHCIQLLKNCYKALPDKGMVIVMDAVVPDSIEKNGQAKVISQCDVGMMAVGSGGKERTEKEFEALAKEAGFDTFQLVCRVFNNWVMEFRKMVSR